MRKLVIPGKLPGLNEAFGYARTNKHKEAAERREAERTIMWAAKGCLRGFKAKGPVVLHYHFYEPNKRRDKDNIAGYAMKLIQDSLVKGGYLDGDGWRHIENFDFSWHVDNKIPRIEVELEELNAEK